MKRNVLIVVLMIFCMSISLAFAEETEKIELTPPKARWSLTKKGLGIGLGALAGLVGHELGHQIVAEIEDVEMTWQGTNWSAQGKKSELKKIALGGFAEQMISSEIILGCNKIPKDNSFVIGYMAWNIINPIWYTIRNETKDGGYGDLKIIDECGLKDEYVEVAIIGHALFSAWRLYKKKEFPIWIKVTRKEIGIYFRWYWK